MKKCPYCAEKIQDEAIICRYCGRDQPKQSPIENKQKSDPPRMSSPGKKAAKIAAVITLLYVISIFFRYQNAPAELAGSLTIGSIITFFVWWVIVSLVISVWRKFKGKESGITVYKPRQKKENNTDSGSPIPTPLIKIADEKESSSPTPASVQQKKQTNFAFIPFIALLVLIVLIWASSSTKGNSNVIISPTPTEYNIVATPTFYFGHLATMEAFLSSVNISIPERWWTNCIGKSITNTQFDQLLNKDVCMYGTIESLDRRGTEVAISLNLPQGGVYSVVVISDYFMRYQYNISTSNDAITDSLKLGDCLIGYGYPQNWQFGTVTYPVFWPLKITDAPGLAREVNDSSTQNIISSCK